MTFHRIGADAAVLLTAQLSHDIFYPTTGSRFAQTALQPNDFRFSWRDGIIAFSIAWTGETARTHTFVDPATPVRAGQALHLTLMARDAERDVISRLETVTLQRNASEAIGGPCPDGASPEPYCPR